MYYTAAILLEKALASLDVPPIFFQTTPLSPLKWFESYHKHDSMASDRLYLLDNTKGKLPLSSCQELCHGIYLTTSEESHDFYKKWMEDHPSCRSLLVLPGHVTRRQVEKALMDAFTFYNDWYEHLLAMIRDRHDWFSLIDAAHDILQNPMLIYNSSMRLLAFTKDDGTSDPIWTDTVSSRTAQTTSSEDATELLRWLEKADRSDAPFLHVGKGMSVPFYSCNITAGDHRLGMVTELEKNHAVTAAHQDILWIFAHLLTIPMQQESVSRQTTGLATKQLIQDLLDGTITSQSLLTTRLLACHWQPRSMVRIFQFRPAIPYITETGWNKSLEELSALPLHGIGCLLSDQLLYLYTSDTAEISDPLLETIQQFCHTHHLRCGISDAFSQLLEVPHHRDQPRLAMELSAKDLCFYEEVRFANLTHHLQSYPNPGDLIHPAILRLHTLDQETGSAYIATLKALFDNQYRQVDAALSLGIHRTTLFYRLQKIEELTGLHISDAREMLHLQLSLLICDL